MCKSFFHRLKPSFLSENKKRFRLNVNFPVFHRKFSILVSLHVDPSLQEKIVTFFRFCGLCLRHSYNFVQNFYTFFVLISNLDIEKQFFWYFGSRSTPFRERGICERKKGFRDSVMFSTNWLYKINVYVFLTLFSFASGSAVCFCFSFPYSFLSVYKAFCLTRLFSSVNVCPCLCVTVYLCLFWGLDFWQMSYFCCFYRLRNIERNILDGNRKLKCFVFYFLAH